MKEAKTYDFSKEEVLNALIEKYPVLKIDMKFQNRTGTLSDNGVFIVISQREVDLG